MAAAQTVARPSPALVDSCLRTESVSPKVQYSSITANAFQVIEDEAAGKTDITLQYGQDTIGIWEVKKKKVFGLVLNGNETSLTRVTRLDKRQSPAAFNPYEAIWGEAREGNKSYFARPLTSTAWEKAEIFKTCADCT